MGKTSNKSKYLWERAHYTQVKVNADKDVATAFKATCKSSGQSMAKVISDFMKKYAKTKSNGHPLPRADTRRERRKEAEVLLLRLERILTAETASAENTPENLRNSERYEATEAIIACLEEAAEALREAYR